MDYSEHDIDQMIDEIFEKRPSQPPAAPEVSETVTKICRKCGAEFPAKKGQQKTLCRACFSAARAANGRLGGQKSPGTGKNHRGAAQKPGWVDPTPESGAGGSTAAESSREGATSPGPAGPAPLAGGNQGSQERDAGSREREALTVGKLLELLEGVPRDAVIREITAVELRSTWTPAQGRRAELYFRKEEER